MSIILTPFAKLLLLFYNITGSYGVSIILFGLVVRLVLSPIFLKGRKGMLAMSGLAEKQKVLAQKYARDREKYSQELTKLYEQEGVKPSSGCLWSFLPLPFLMVLYAIIRQPLTYLMNVTEDQFNVISNLLYGEVLNYKNQQLQIAQDVFLNHDKIVAAVPDLAGMPQIDFTFLGVNLSQTPSHAPGSGEHPLPPLLPEKTGKGPGRAPGTGARAHQAGEESPGRSQAQGPGGDAQDPDGAQAQQEHRRGQPGGHPRLRQRPSV